ncbi:MAG: S-layer homology domain-containing protein [Armatimonadetes bacterium]|nr:S-layer homology domain-containing protein [Armatimonadota bacterium]
MDLSRRWFVYKLGPGLSGVCLLMLLVTAMSAAAQAAVIRCESATGAAGTVVQVPIFMDLAAGEESNKFQLILQVSPADDSPVLTADLAYQNLLSPAAGKVGPTAMATFEAPDTSILDVAWRASNSMFDMIVGPTTVTLGKCLITIPNSAEAGDSYAVHLVPYDEATKLGTVAKIATSGPIPTTPGPDVNAYVPGGATYTLNVTVTPSGAGAVAGGGSYPSGVVATVTAIPHDGWEFLSWTGDASGSENPLTITIDGNKSISAKFVEPVSFTDVPEGYWARTAIAACVETGIVAGYPDGLYRPTREVDRGSMAVYIARALSGGDAYVPSGPAEATFPDVAPDHWTFKYVEYASSRAIVGGYGDGSYQPTWSVSRAQMSVFIARSIVDPTGEEGLADYTPPEETTFTDVPDSFWCFNHLEYLVEQGIVSGYPDGTYKPSATVTRDQMAVYIARAFGLM